MCRKFSLLMLLTQYFPTQVPAKSTNSIPLLFPALILQAEPNELAHVALNLDFKAKLKEDGFIPHPIGLNINSIFKAFIQGYHSSVLPIWCGQVHLLRFQ